MGKNKNTNCLKGMRRRDLCAKIFGTVSLFVVVTAALLLSRGSTLLIVAQLRQQEVPRCLCDREEVLYEDDDARPAWLWTLLLIISIPHWITFFHSLILTLTKLGELEKPRETDAAADKRKKQWKPKDWLLVSLQPLTGILQTIGLCILFFIAVCFVGANG